MKDPQKLINCKVRINLIDFPLNLSLKEMPQDNFERPSIEELLTAKGFSKLKALRVFWSFVTMVRRDANPVQEFVSAINTKTITDSDRLNLEIDKTGKITKAYWG